jgi:uncharacterized membrane protein
MTAQENPFIIGESLHAGWQRAKERFWYLVAVLVVSFIVMQLPRSIAMQMPDNSLPAFLLAILSMVLNFAVSYGLVRIAIAEARGQKSNWEFFKAPLKEYWRFLKAAIVITLIVIVGFILLIVPGIIWSLKYQYVMYLVVDKKMGLRDAMKMSAQMTDGVKWDLVGFGFVMGVINILGLLALGIGLLITVPTTMIAQAHVYNRLLKRVKE